MGLLHQFGFTLRSDKNCMRHDMRVITCMEQCMYMALLLGYSDGVERINNQQTQAEYVLGPKSRDNGIAIVVQHTQ